jgi:hypothetical protein
MEKVEIEFSYSQMIDYRMQKDFYEKFGKKRRLKIAIYYVLITVIALGGGYYSRDNFFVYLIFFEYLIATILVLPWVLFWTRQGILSGKNGVFRTFNNNQKSIIKVDCKEISLINGGVECDLLNIHGKTYSITIPWIVETDDIIYFAKNARIYLCYIDKKALSQEECEFVTSTLRRLYGKRYKQVM